jgi:hypothetical protein
MTVDELRKALFAKPFVPFVIRTVGGSVLPIDHPEFVALSPGGRTIAVFSTTDNAFEIVDTLMIESLVFTGQGDSDTKRRSA